MKEKPFFSFLDGLGNGLGYSLILIGVALLENCLGKYIIWNRDI